MCWYLNNVSKPQALNLLLMLRTYADTQTLHVWEIIELQRRINTAIL